ncbi:MAG: hypothetical protein LJF06_02210 [Gemmatimonadetes bacterium]|jgi:hypothetical protein|nr:hypothetical protein [Gemmatimonadota bacterium]
MSNSAVGSEPHLGRKVRNLLFILLGVALLPLKRRYTGPWDTVVHSYLGNLSVSFAVYFLFANLDFPPRIRRLVPAAAALVVVELFEALDGFGIMSNTHDPVDFVVNAAGIALALWLDAL